MKPKWNTVVDGGRTAFLQDPLAFPLPVTFVWGRWDFLVVWLTQKICLEKREAQLYFSLPFRFSPVKLIRSWFLFFCFFGGEVCWCWW